MQPPPSNPTANDLFDQDDLPQDTLGSAYRVARSISALIMRMGEGASTTERAAGMVLHDKAHVDSSTHPNSPYGTRSKVAPSSTPNPSTLQQSMSLTSKAVKCWSPPSPSMPTVRSNSPADDNPTTATGGEWTSVRETGDLSASGSSGKTVKASAALPEKHNSDVNELLHGTETILIKHFCASEPAFSTLGVRN